ncbi:MAG: hypothetical protein NT018_09470 [Armatimonadetes bacterium]|nr:hypothetical protein [Armatimonadota bacterium]
MVLLDVLDFGYSGYLRAEADAPSYDGFTAEKGVLSRGEAHDVKPLIIYARTNVAINLEQSSSKINCGTHPMLIGSFPWAYTSCGAPLFPGLNSTHSWLHHSFEITGMANDGTVTVVAAGKCILLKPGGKVRIERSIGLWRSTVAIRHRGIFNKGKIAKSKWLIVERD